MLALIKVVDDEILVPAAVLGDKDDWDVEAKVVLIVDEMICPLTLDSEVIDCVGPIVPPSKLVREKMNRTNEQRMKRDEKFTPKVLESCWTRGE